MKPNILFVFGNQACVPDDPLIAAKKLGCRTSILCSTLPCGISIDHVDEIKKCGLNKPVEVIDFVLSMDRKNKINGVVGYDDQSVPIVSQIANKLGLPGHPVSSAFAARDKVLMKQRFEAAQVPIAKYSLATDEDKAIRWANNNGYPVVIKPVCGSASQGVIRANSDNELRTAYRRVRRIIRDQSIDTAGRPESHLLIENYLDGKEVSVELLVKNRTPHVLCVFEKPELLQGPFFEETIYVTPTSLSVERRTEIEELAVRAVKSLDLCSGAAHCEIRLSSSGPMVLETAARVIGGACSRVFRYVIEEDIHRYIIRLALGQNFSMPRQRPQAAGAMMLPIPSEGRMVSLNGVVQAQQVPGIQDVIVTASIGDVIVPFPEQNCYVGFLTATGNSPQAVTKALYTASEQIKMQLESLTCEFWSRELTDHYAYSSPLEYGIKTLGEYSIEEAREYILPLVAGTSFGELPSHIAWTEAQKCIRWLEEGNRGETCPEMWLIAEGIGVALGSYCRDTSYVSCLGVEFQHRRAGLGEAFVRFLMGIFARKGVKRMQVIIDPRQPAVIRLYKRMGFSRGKSSGQSCDTC